MNVTNTLPVCYGEVYSRVVHNQGIQIATFRFLMVSFVILKVVRNYHALYENKLFGLYFLLLIFGGIIAGTGQAYYAINCGFNENSNNVVSIVNTLEVFGVILLDTFFGLMPNFFYSVYKTKLTKVSDKITQKYFLANGFVMGLLFFIIFITTFTSPDPIISSNITLIVEVVYSFSFYVLVIFELREIEGRVKEVIWRYFSYFTLNAVTILIRSGFLMFGHLNALVPQEQEIVFANYPLDTVAAGIQLLVVVLFLKEIKFSVQKKEKSTQKTSLQSTSQ